MSPVPPDTDSLRRLELAVDRLEAAVQRSEVSMAEQRTALQNKPCERHEQSISDLYDRQDRARGWLIGTLAALVLGLLGVFFYELFQSILQSKGMP